MQLKGRGHFSVFRRREPIFPLVRTVASLSISLLLSFSTGVAAVTRHMPAINILLCLTD
jgi:hypothetical protein